MNFVSFYILGATAANALSIGYQSIFIDDFCRDVNFNDIENTEIMSLINRMR